MNRILIQLSGGAECAEFATHRDTVIEKRLLDVVLFVLENNDHRLQLKQGLLADISRLDRLRQPPVVLVQDFRNCLEVLQA